MACMLIFILLGLFAGPILIADNYQALGLPYFKWLMTLGFIFPFNVALASFYAMVICTSPTLATILTVKVQANISIP